MRVSGQGEEQSKQEKDLFEHIETTSGGGLFGGDKLLERSSERGKSVSPELVDITDRLNSLLLDLVNLKYELLKEKKEKGDIKEKYEELQGRRDELERMVSSQLEEIQALNAKVRTLELQNHTLAVRLSEEEEKLNEERRAKRQLIEILKDREENISKLNTKLTEKEEEISHLGEKLQKITIELSNSLVTIGNLEETNRELVGKIKYSESRLQEIQEKLKEKEIFIEKVKTENEILKSELKSLMELIDTQQSVVETLVKEKNELLRKIKEFEKEASDKFLEVEKERAKRKMLETAHQKVVEESSRILEKFDALAKENERLERENRCLKEKNLKFQETIEYWESQFKQIKDKVNQTSAGELIKLDEIRKKLSLSFLSLPEDERNLFGVLVNSGFLDTEQISSIKSLFSAGAITNLEHYLIENNIVDEAVVYIALSLIDKIPYFYIYREDIDFTIVDFLGINYCIEKLIAPLKTNREISLFAMANPKDEGLLRVIGSKIKRQISGVYTSPSRIIEILEQFLSEE